MHDTLAKLIDYWKSDPRSTYNTWFLWEERLKNFCSIRRGIGEVVRDVEAQRRGQVLQSHICLIARPDPIRAPGFCLSGGGDQGGVGEVAEGGEMAAM